MLEFNFPEWAFVIVNLAVLILILRVILWKRVGRVLDERQARIEKAIGDAEAIENEKATLEAKRTAHIDELNQKTASQMQEARVRAGREYDRIVAEADEKARAILSSAQAQGIRELEGVQRAARSEVVAVALELTGALLGTKMSGEVNAQLVETFLTQRFGSGQSVGKETS